LISPDREPEKAALRLLLSRHNGCSARRRNSPSSRRFLLNRAKQILFKLLCTLARRMFSQNASARPFRDGESRICGQISNQLQTLLRRSGN
jgi:hypothetical protein